MVLARQVMTQLNLRRNLVALRESTIQCQQADKALQQGNSFQQAILNCTMDN